MDVADRGRKDQQVQVSWIPTTPLKPILQRPAPICAAEEENPLTQPNCFETSSCVPSPILDCHVDRVAACFKSSLNAENNSRPNDQAAAATTVTNVAGENAGTCCIQPSVDTNSYWNNFRFADLLALADAASAHYTATAPGNNDGVKNPSIPSLKSQFNIDPAANPTSMLFGHSNLSPELTQTSSIYGNPTQGISYVACHSKIISQLAPPTPDKATRAESRQVPEIQINREEENNVLDTKLHSNETPHSQELSDPIKESSFAVVPTPFEENHNPDKGGSDGIDLNKTPQQKPKKKKHRPKVITEGKPKRTRKPVTPKPVQSKENPTGKRKYVRRKALNNTSTTPAAEVSGESTEPVVPESTKKTSRRSLNFGTGEQPRDENPAFRENATLHFGKGTDVGAEQMHVGLAYDAQAPCTSPEDAQAPCTSSKSNLPGEKPTGKRKYVRRKALNNTSTTPATEVTGESTEPAVPESTKKSCRRSLNFDTGEQPRDENPAFRENVTLHYGKGTDVGAEQTHVGLAYDLNFSTKQVLNNCMSSPEDVQAPCTTSKSNLPGEKPNANSVKNNSKRKGRGKKNTAKIISKMKTQSSPYDSNSSNGGILTTGLQMGGSKRKYSATIEQANTRGMNLIGAQYNGLQAYQTGSWVQFPKVQKKRRSEKGQTSNTSTTSSVTTARDAPLLTCLTDAGAHPYAASSSCCIPGSEYNAARVPVIFEATERAIHDKAQTFESILSLSQTRLTKRRSRVPTRIRKSASLSSIGTCNAQPNHSTKRQGNSDRQTYEDAEKPQTCIDALVADMCASLKKKKRTKKKSTLVSLYSSTNEMQLHHKFVLDNYHLFLDKSSDAACEVTWKSPHTMDALTEQFIHLDITREARDFTFQEHNAIVPYDQQNKKHNAIIQKDGTIIPFQGSFDPIRKQRPRPKVDLDEETDRVWKLLLLNINSHGIDGTDEQKAKWWEEERRVFRGRADSFIARMHLVQGDRRFSRWKGSVVDSVIGVFLTQNVSDHLSSSAFMSLAARFPLKPSSTCKTYHEEGSSLVVKKPQVHIVEPEENTKRDAKMLNQSSMTIDIIELSEERDTVKSNDSSTRSGISLADESNFKLLKSAESNIKEYHSLMMSAPTGTIIGARQDKSCYGGIRKELNNAASSQCSIISSQVSGDFSIDQNLEKIGSSSDSNSEIEELSSTPKYNIFDNNTSFSKLLEMASSTMLHEVCSQRRRPLENSKDAYGQSIGIKHDNQTENFEKSDVIRASLEASITPSSDYVWKLTPNSGALEVHCFDAFKTGVPSSGFSKTEDENNMNRASSHMKTESQSAIAHSQIMISQIHLQEQSNSMQQHLLNSSGEIQDLMQKVTDLDSGDHNYAVTNENKDMNAAPIKQKSKRLGKEKKDNRNWDILRIQAEARAGKREKTANTMDSLDWDAVRCADVSEIAEAIKERGMNNMLAERIKNFLNRLVEEHGGIDLEWLRDVPPDQAKEYLLSIRGLGLKSVECVRLLTLHHLAFPVDTNVGRIAVRLGWVPLQPLPESLQLHLLELYPVLESIQKYLWPRLCKLDQRTLYELHYQMITFGKVFCTKNKPNCNACPMRGECRHFASAFASARLALPGPEQRSIVTTAGNNATEQNPSIFMGQLPLPLPEQTNQAEEIQQTVVSRQPEAISEINVCQPIIEEPATPEPEWPKISENDIEDGFYEDSCEIPTIKLNIEEFTLNLQNYMQENMELQECELSKALVALTPEAASIPTPKLKNVSRLRTEHCVYELPDSHPLLEGWDRRESDDPCSYLLAIWTPGETANSIQPPESKCSSQECGQLCNEKECFSCNSIREANSQIVRGTLLIPCRTAMKGSFPLNGTYFQVNEVFADHDSSLNPINVPRSLIWNLNRRTVYFGTSIPSIFKGLSTQEIQQCFWRGFVCVRGFERGTRAPRPLMARLHFPASKLAKTKEQAKKK